jgi:hypothetical protein
LTERESAEIPKVAEQTRGTVGEIAAVEEPGAEAIELVIAAPAEPTDVLSRAVPGVTLSPMVEVALVESENVDESDEKEIFMQDEF